MNKLIAALAVVALCVTAAAAAREQHSAAVRTLHGTIAAIADGDTLYLRGPEGADYEIRLSDLDAPELYHSASANPRDGSHRPERPGQPFGREAADSLRELAAPGSPARAECFETDRYARHVCHLFVEGRNVNLEQLRRGWAMLPHKAEWIREERSYTAAAEARAAGRGLWRRPDPIHPADWRRECWHDGRCPGAVMEGGRR